MLEKNIFIKDLKPHDTVHSTFLVKGKETPLARNGKPYLAISLMDRSGEIDSRVWENATDIAETFDTGDVIAVGGKVNAYQNRLQLIVDHLIPVSAEEVDLRDFLPEGPENVEALYKELLSVFEAVENPWVRKLSLALLKDPEIAERYKVCPAAKTIHHAFLGGLLVHSLQLIHLVDAVLKYYEGIDRDIAVFGAAFHDFGKIFELSYNNAFSYTDEGKLVGHITIGAILIDRKIREIPGFPRELEYQLKHIVLAHHGHLEYGSPKRPHTIEAQLVHQLDDMDSKINSIQTFMQSVKGKSRWTPEHRAYHQYYYRPDIYLNAPN
ncbi:MAG: OB-fold nucleic acid binding domain-containing protein [Bdellovibrionota bacterium]